MWGNVWGNVLVVAGVLGVVTVACLAMRSYDGRFRHVAEPMSTAEPQGADPTGDSGDSREFHVSRDYGDRTGDAPEADPGREPRARTEPNRITAADLGQPLGERATLLQFSSAFCAPCRATRVILADVATAVPGVRHIEMDAESHLDLVRRLGVVRTPTTFVLDADGRIRTRASGLARRPAVVAALDAALR